MKNKGKKTTMLMLLSAMVLYGAVSCGKIEENENGGAAANVFTEAEVLELSDEAEQSSSDVEAENTDPDAVYQAKGTGAVKPADYKPVNKYSRFCDISRDYYSIHFLKDKKMEGKINDDIDEICKNFDVKERCAEILNGYMNITLYGEYVYEDDEDNFIGRYRHQGYTFIKTLNYDLKNGKEIKKYSDLFYQGEDFVPAVNEIIKDEFTEIYPGYVKKDFEGLCGQVENFTLTGVIMDDTGAYLSCAMNLNIASYSDCIADSMVISEYYANEHILEDWCISYDEPVSEWNIGKVTADDGEEYKTVIGSRFHTDDEVAKQQAVYKKVFETAKQIRSEEGYDDSTAIIIEPPYKSDYADTLNVITVVFGKMDGCPDYKYIFDASTGERITLTDIFGEGFEKYTYKHIEDLDVKNGTFTIWDETDGEYGDKVIELSKDELNMKYISDAPEIVEYIDITQPLVGKISVCGAEGYASSYITDYGPKEIISEPEPDQVMKITGKCRSHGSVWVECSDEESGEYCGWVNSGKIILK